LSIKVLQVTESYGKGGAGLGVQNLQQALVRAGVNSHVFTMQACKNIESCDGELTLCRNFGQRARRWIIGKHSRKVRQSYPDREASLFSLNQYGAALHKKIEDYAPDIIHLHWINRHMLSIADIGSFSPPIIWTMRDCWPFTGGCHYKFGCNKFAESCGTCPILGSNQKNDISAKIHALKRKHWQHANIHPVGISPWITKQANSAPFFKHSTQTIWNSVNEAFCDTLVKESRQKRREELDQKIIRACIVSINPDNDKRKGTLDALDALGMIHEKGKVSVQVSIIGAQRVDAIESRYPSLKIQWLGYISDIQKLATIYQNHHILLAPSHEEAFGKTIAEAMTQGTPAIVYSGSGPESMIRHKKDGIVAQLGSRQALAEGIEFLSNSQKWLENSQNAQSSGRQNFSSTSTARNYKMMYHQLMEAKNLL